jgi:hypothetical protein
VELNAARRALVLPDLPSWLLWGEDLTGDGLRRVVAPEQAELLLTPSRLPAPLADAAREAWERMPPARSYESRPSPLGGEPIEKVLAGARTGGHDLNHRDHADHMAVRHEAHGNHMAGGHEDHMAGGHDHHDMMAVVGDPSRDGLVMEDIDLELGPLSPSLPGGLVIEIALDGDVVARAQAHAMLRADSEAGPDPLAPLSWRVALAGTRIAPGVAVLAVEVERALSHAAWLHTLGYALGWSRLADRALELARTLLPARAAAVAALDTELDPTSVAQLRETLNLAAVGADRLRRLLDGRTAGRRLRGLAPVDAGAVEARGIAGPVARAAGVDADSRRDDPRYAALGFEPVVAETGDAEARTAVRAVELRASLNLAAAALDVEGPDESARAGEGPRGSFDAPGGPDEEGPVVEGPRGPLDATAGPAAAGLLELAGEAIAGLEVADAIVALVSFDLSPWRVAP